MNAKRHSRKAGPTPRHEIQARIDEHGAEQTAWDRSEVQWEVDLAFYAGVLDERATTGKWLTGALMLSVILNLTLLYVYVLFGGRWT